MSSTTQSFQTPPGEATRTHLLRLAAASLVPLEDRRTHRELSRHQEADGPRQTEQRDQPLL